MKQNRLLQFVLATILISTCSCIQLSITLEAREGHCFFDSLGEMIIYHFDILSSQGQHMKFTIKNPDQSIHFEKTGQNKIVYKVATEQEGEYGFCFENMDYSTSITIYFDYKTGVDAKDYTDLISKEQGQKFKLNAQKLSDTLHDISVEKKLIIRHQQFNSSLSKELSFKIQGFSVITGVLLLALAIFQSYYLRQFFKEKKMI